MLPDDKSKLHEDLIDYRPVNSSTVESIDDCIEGGYHPVNLGDILDEKLEVVAKLGHGRFSTVWLCFDKRDKKWRAVKVLAARHSIDEAPELELTQGVRSDQRHYWSSAHLELPLAYFFLHGLNGRHHCLVQRVLGPSIQWVRDRAEGEADEARLRQLLYQGVTALETLGVLGICHGDFGAHNILLRLSNMDHISKKEMQVLLGLPRRHEVMRLEDGQPGDRAPDYLVEPVCLWTQLGEKGIHVVYNIAVVDFGLSFRLGLGRAATAFVPTATRYRAPELYFPATTAVGPGSDLWAFVCSMMEVYTGSCGLFGTRNCQAYAEDLEYLLGPLAYEYRSSWIGEMTRARRLGYEPALRDRNGRLLPVTKSPRQLAQLQLEDATPDYRSRFLDHLVQSAAGLSLVDLQALADLAYRTFKYHPRDRISVSDVTYHDWFKDAREALTSGNGSALEEYPQSPLRPGYDSDTDDSSEDESSWIYTGARLLQVDRAPGGGYLHMPPDIFGPVSDDDDVDDASSIDAESPASYATDSSVSTASSDYPGWPPSLSPLDFHVALLERYRLARARQRGPASAVSSGRRSSDEGPPGTDQHDALRGADDDDEEDGLPLLSSQLRSPSIPGSACSVPSQPGSPPSQQGNGDGYSNDGGHVTVSGLPARTPGEETGSPVTDDKIRQSPVDAELTSVSRPDRE